MTHTGHFGPDVDLGRRPDLLGLYLRVILLDGRLTLRDIDTLMHHWTRLSLETWVSLTVTLFAVLYSCADYFWIFTDMFLWLILTRLAGTVIVHFDFDIFLLVIASLLAGRWLITTRSVKVHIESGSRELRLDLWQASLRIDSLKQLRLMCGCARCHIINGLTIFDECIRHKAKIASCLLDGLQL